MVLRHLLVTHQARNNNSKVAHTPYLPKWLLAMDDDTMVNPMTLLRTLGEHDPKEIKVFGNR